MSRSPFRMRGDPAECWRAVLFGEILRVLDTAASVRADTTIRLPRTGRWESGLARLRPALDDVLGSTAFAVAWRWACAEHNDNAWPGLPLIAAKATDRAVTVAPMPDFALLDSGAVIGPAGARIWRLVLPGGAAAIGVRAAFLRDWSEVDRIAEVTAAWFDAPWSIVEQLSEERPELAPFGDRER